LNCDFKIKQKCSRNQHLIQGKDNSKTKIIGCNMSAYGNDCHFFYNTKCTKV